MASAEEKEKVIKRVPKTSSEKRLIVILEKASLESVKVLIFDYMLTDFGTFVLFKFGPCIFGL